MLSVSLAILNFTDLHDAFCEACGSAGLVELILGLLEQQKTCTPDFHKSQVCIRLNELLMTRQH